MPWFRLPSFFGGSKVASRSNNQSVPSTSSVNQAKDDSSMAVPTSKEYAGEAAKEFLDALEAVADQIPLPGVATIVKVAKNIIHACDDSHATLERAEELKQRIRTLMTVLVNKLKEKKKGERIQAELEADIQSLSNDLEYIQGKINEISSQNALLLILFKGLNEEKVKKCMGRLDNSLTNFGLARQINDAKFLHVLEQEILAFHNSHQKSLDDMSRKVDHLQTTMDDLKIILDENHEHEQLSTSATCRRRPRAKIPAKGAILRGRDALVAQLVQILISNLDGQKRSHICLLGPGGMGKTSTALAVMADPNLKNHFAEQNRIWVPCVKATSYSLLLDTLYNSLGTTQNTGDTLQDILSGIHSSKKPVILLLDNFETPWNLAESRSDTEQLLNELDQIPHVSLFITMRSSIPPCDGKQWLPFEIEAVDDVAARQIYLDIYPASSDDPKLSALLQILGYMPLAITLTAKRAATTKLGAEELFEEYQRVGTTMLGRGGDAKHSVDVSISLSIDSPPMKAHKEAFELLAILSMLPVGTTYDGLKKWWASNLRDLTGALEVLCETALVQRRGDHYSVLPVIQSYTLDNSRFPDHVRTEMITSACKFLGEHKSSPGDLFFKEHSDALSDGEVNLQAVLLKAQDPDPNLIEAFLILAAYQLSTRPRLEVIRYALKLARELEGHQSLLGEVLTCYGRILLYLDRYEPAEKYFVEARQIFLSIANEKRAAHCWLNLVELYRARSDRDFEKELPLVMGAKSAFERLNDTEGVALSLYYRGIIYGQNGDPLGIQYLTDARERFQNLGDRLNQAKCTYELQWAHYWTMNFDKAVEFGEAAIKEYQDILQYSGLAIQLLGRTLFMIGDYPLALQKLVDALPICKSYGRPTDIAQTLEMIGRAWAKMGQIADAQGVYLEAMRYYSAISGPIGKWGMTRCQFLTHKAEDPFLVPNSEETSALVYLYKDFL
ncbi:hypothetical protein GALMADRAFT_229257 [Galerina marginata CBS 339.88]|uniref:Uncharacterized protein n=1 Tax=Galerina marginata (strain CBS 339.88) TaxID=685588 RepID=A0A067SY53_GALM3|nr:hypothetical protein GALMADRAFT_229257 [Galerina marginata CBS 339.88]